MRIRRVAAGVMPLLLLGASAVAAQEPSKIGITMGYPSIGVIWHVSERVAVRPEVSWSFGSTASTTALPLQGVSVDRKTSSWSTGTGVSVLFYLAKSDNLSTYVSPRVGYTRSGVDTDNSTDSTSSGYSIAGMFGAEYSLGRRFSVFGEVGVGFSWQKSGSSSITTFDIRSHSVGTRTGAGVILYF
jgi:hypothetical protein